MTLTGASVRAALLEQTERTRRCSKADIERTIKESELEIISFDAQIAALIKSRDSHRARILALRHIVSPIRTLPVELLVEVFKHAIGPGPYPDIYNVCRLTHVCSEWRHVAHSTPRLWTRLQIDADRCRLEGDAVDGFEVCLARSASMPVHISFTGDVDSNIVELMLWVAPRLASLRLSAKVPEWLLEELADSELESLEVLDMSGPGRDVSTLTFATVPRLRKFGLKPPVPALIVMPWAQLTELTLDCDSQVTLDILAQCTNIVTASIRLLKRLPRQDSPFPFNQLRSLSLFVWDDFAPLLDFLSTPALQELELNWLHTRVAQSSSLKRFQLRAPNITRLALCCPDWLTPKRLKTAIRNAPSLTHLELVHRERWVKDELIETLHYEDDVTPLAPHLHNLIIESKWGGSEDWEDVLVGMVASRWWTDDELASLVVPPAVARWTRVEIRTRRALRSDFADLLEEIPADVLVYLELEESDDIDV